MKFRYLLCCASLVAGLSAGADTVRVSSMRYAGPYPLTAPFEIDSVDVASAKYDRAARLATPISLDLVKTAGREFTDSVLPTTGGDALHLLSFDLDNSRYASAGITVKGVKSYEMYIDGRKASGGKQAMTPRTRSVVIKCLTDTSAVADTVRVSIDTDAPDAFTVNPSDGRRYSTRDMFTGRFIGSVAVSPSGKYLYTGYYNVDHDGKRSADEYVLSEASTGRVVAMRHDPLAWMPKSDLMYYTRERNKKIELVTVDPATWSEKIVASGLPSMRFTLSPTEDFIIYTRTVNGPREKNEGLYQILNPEDRQPGWRNRGQIMKYDFATGISSPLTHGYKGVSASNVTDDGSKMLFMVYDQDFVKRPSSLASLYLLDLTTMKAECLVEKDGFMKGAVISPDGIKVALTASPEAFGGVGKNLPDGMVPNMYDSQLYVMDIASREITPLTRDFDPSVNDMRWSRADGCIYFSADDRDRKSLFRANPVNGKVESLGVPEDYVMRYSLAANAPVVAYAGQSSDNSVRLYSLDTRKLKHTVRDDLNPVRTAGLRISPTHDWSFRTSRGDTVHARYNLPIDYVEGKKYPVIVYYYGGCNPVQRLLETTYNPQLFASHGFVSMVINPSGAAGFGQEFAARHVATAGEGVADDIIEGVKQFTAEHSFVDADKIGCCGASYGGFMTQYLQTVTDIFAAAISHAGISDHTSYWGEGYWGYSYSQVSMGDKLPWSDRDLYVSHSPLYNADKINTPLLFLHGDSDTNVPFGESVQMFTALKLLGKETAMVAVKGQDHHILDFDKREKWLSTIMAWFTKYLQDDSSWWDSMYDTKVLK